MMKLFVLILLACAAYPQDYDYNVFTRKLDIVGSSGGGITSIDATGGVETTTGNPITSSGTIRGTELVNAQTGTTYTFLTGDRNKLVTASNALSQAYTLPQAGGTFPAGWSTIVKNIGVGDVVITSVVSTISDAATITLSLGEWAIITSNGTDYESRGNRTLPGTGILLTKSRTSLTTAVDTSIILSKATYQSGVPVSLISASSSATVFTASISSNPLTAYTRNQSFQWTPDVNCGVSPTLNVDTLGAIALKKIVGTAIVSLTTDDCLARVPYQINAYASSGSTVDAFVIDPGPAPSSIAALAGTGIIVCGNALCFDTSFGTTNYAHVNAGSTYSSGVLQDFTLAKMALPASSGCISSAANPFCLDTLNLVLKFWDGGADETVVTIGQTQTLSNKTFVAPALGTPASGVMTNVTGYLWSALASRPFVKNAQTSTYQVLAADFDQCKTIPVASGTFNITLVASGSQPADGKCIRVLNYGSGTPSIVRSGQNINGGTASITLAAGSAAAPTGLLVTSDGTDYFAQPLGSGGLPTGLRLSSTNFDVANLRTFSIYDDASYSNKWISLYDNGYALNIGTGVSGVNGGIGFYSTAGIGGNPDATVYRVGAGVLKILDGPSGAMGTLQAIPRTPPVAVGSLPACGAGLDGAHHAVNDSNAASFTVGIGAVVAAGGSTHVPVYCDGTNWRIG